MKSLWQTQKPRAFTLIEVLVVIAIIAILAAMLLPALLRGKQRAQRIQCIGDMNQLGTAFQIFAHDHQGRFPMQTPIADGGSYEYVAAGNSIPGTFYFSYRHFQPLANELVVPRLLVCPADQAREKAQAFSSLQNSNVSYFVAAYAAYNVPETILAGDRNITNDAMATPSLVRGIKGLRWTSEMHVFKGNVLFSDSHVAEMNNAGLDLQGTAAANADFFLPAVRTPGLLASAPPASGGTPPQAASQDPSSGTTLQNPPPATMPPASAGAQANAGSGTPPPQTPMPLGNRMSSSSAGRGRDSMTSFSEASAEEKHGNAATNAARPPVAPAVEDDGGTPLLWLQGAAKTVVVKTGGWLWLLLLLLLAAAAYAYSRWKKHREDQR